MDADYRARAHASMISLSSNHLAAYGHIIITAYPRFPLAQVIRTIGLTDGAYCFPQSVPNSVVVHKSHLLFLRCECCGEEDTSHKLSDVIAAVATTMGSHPWTFASSRCLEQTELVCRQ